MLLKSKFSKFVFIIFILGLFAYSIFVAYKYSRRQANISDGEYLGESGLEISALSGKIRTKDFSRQAIDETEINLLLADTSDYRVVYYKQENAFVITLLSLPLEQSRKKAGEFLKSELGVDERQLCRLKISVDVPYEVNPSFSGRNLGLGVCLDSEDL